MYKIFTKTELTRFQSYPAYLRLLLLFRENNINQLLQELTQSLADKSFGDMGWRIYQVKLDLEARGIITSKEYQAGQRKW
jgi:hypothetical protein